MKILRFTLGQLQANCYFLIEGNECLIIDPADEASFILEELQRRKLKLVGMLATHGHFDHIMAAGEIQLSILVPFYIFEKDLFLVKRLNETAKYFLGFDPHSLPPKRIEHLKTGEFHISQFTFHILSTPGYTPGSICYYFSEEKLIFTGDTLFRQGIGRYDFSYSDKNELRKSLGEIFGFPDETRVYPGHGEITSIKEEKKNVNLIV